MSYAILGQYFAPAAAILLSSCGAPRVASFMKPPAAPRSTTPEMNLIAARDAWNILADATRRDEWLTARQAYNRALAGSFDDLRRANSDWNQAAADIGTRWTWDTPHSRDPYQLGALFPASKVKTTRVGERKMLAGIGLPLAGWIDESTDLYPNFRFAPPSGVPITATTLLRFDRGPTPTWEILHPSFTESVSIGGAQHPLEIDFSAGHALYWRMSELDKHKISNVLRPDRMDGVEGLFYAQPLQKDRIPVVFIHGFNSSPDAFAPMVNELMGEAWFRRNYQVWVFSYPTGVPWMLSAARFRKHFHAATTYARSQGVHMLDRTVMIGHSMGGLITHASLKDPGIAAYNTFARKPLHQLDLRPDERRMVEEVFLWKPIRPVSRAIFIATPHRGSPISDTFYSAFGSSLIKLPKTLTVDLSESFVRNAAAITNPTSLTTEVRLAERSATFRIPTVIESLSPTRPGIQAIQTRPFPKNVHLHSIIGDRGRGQTDGGSDGVVPYWSSHLIEAESEVIVPANHSAAEHPLAIAEVKRILKMHLDKIMK
jgi:pimeloyl-ACP methyl ester carboxylesterase